MKVSFYTWPSKEHSNELIPSFVVVVGLNTVAETTFDLVPLYQYFKRSWQPLILLCPTLLPCCCQVVVDLLYKVVFLLY